MMSWCLRPSKNWLAIASPCSKAPAKCRSSPIRDLVEGLKQLPAPDDSLVFFDGRQMFSAMHDIGKFIRGESHGDPKAERAAAMMDKILDEVSILDYTIATEYTDGQKNGKTTLIKMMPDASTSALAAAVHPASRSSTGNGLSPPTRFRIRSRPVLTCIRFTSA